MISFSDTEIFVFSFWFLKGEVFSLPTVSASPAVAGPGRGAHAVGRFRSFV